MANSARNAQSRALLSFAVGGRECELRMPTSVMDARQQLEDAQAAVLHSEKVAEDKRREWDEAQSHLDAAIAYRHHSRDLYNRVIRDPRDPAVFDVPDNLESFLAARQERVALTSGDS